MIALHARPLVLASFGAIATPLAAQCANAWIPFGHLPGVGAAVTAFANWDPDGPGPASAQVVVGGWFAAAGAVPAMQVATWDPATAQWSALGAGLAIQQLTVNALLALPNGELIAGGACSATISTAVHPLLRWNGTAWVPFGGLTPTPVGVSALARLPNGDIAVGGAFTAGGATTLSNIGTWNGTSWTNLGGGTNGPVHDLLVLPNGDLVAVGWFTVAGGVPANGIARWDGAAWSALGGGITSLSASGPMPGAVALLPNGDLVVGGTFTHAGGAPAANLARWDGGAWSAFGSGLTAPGFGGVGVWALAVLPAGDLVAGGFFLDADGVPVQSIARWDGFSWASLGTGVSARSYVNALVVLANGDLVAGGTFTVAGSVGASHVARWDGTAWSALGDGNAPSSHLRSLLTMPDGSIVAGGAFQAAGGVVANGLARWDGASWAPLGSGTSTGAIHAMALRPNGDLVVGGEQFFGTWDGVSWTPLATSFSGAVPHADFVEAVAVLPNGDLAVAGDFSRIGQYWILGLARWDGTAWSTFGGEEPGEVHTLAVLDNGDLVVGGDLWAMTPPANGIARWDGSAWSPLGSGLQAWGAAGEAFAIAPLPNGGLIAGGSFTTAGGLPASNIARWNGTSWSPLGAGTNALVRTVHVLPNGDVIAAGEFTQAGGVPVGGIARWNGTAWSAVGGHTGYGRGFAITAEANGDVLVGGYFDTVGGMVSPNLVRLTTTCPAFATSAGPGCAANTVTATLPWTGSTWRADASGLPSSAAVLVVHGFGTVSLPLAAVFPTALPGCTLHVTPEVVDLTFAANGGASFAFALPNTAVLAGITFHHQMVPIVLDATLAVTATNALQLTVGSF
jgi:hypothetical protein